MFDKLSYTLDDIRQKPECFMDAAEVDRDDLSPLRTAVELLTGFREFDTRRLYKRRSAFLGCPNNKQFSY